MKGLNGKVVLIAGGATGLGEATARRLTEEGCQVAVDDINIDKARSRSATTRPTAPRSRR